MRGGAEGSGPAQDVDQVGRDLLARMSTLDFIFICFVFFAYKIGLIVLSELKLWF